jgi:hypothetical protein
MFPSQIFFEFDFGPISTAQARDLREGLVQSNSHIEIAIDAMSVFTATTAAHIKIPSETSLVSHIQYVRELLDKRIINAL